MIGFVMISKCIYLTENYNLNKTEIICVALYVYLI